MNLQNFGNYSPDTMSHPRILKVNSAAGSGNEWYLLPELPNIDI